MQVAWLTPAHKPNPFQMIKDVTYHDAGGNLGGEDEENADDSQTATAQMASSDASPDVEPEAETQGKVRRRASAPAARAITAAPPDPRTFFQRLFDVITRPEPTTMYPTYSHRRGPI